jgi:hypothetical protein
MYGDDSYNEEKNNLFDIIQEFLDEHPVSELLSIVSDAVKYKNNVTL